MPATGTTRRSLSRAKASRKRTRRAATFAETSRLSNSRLAPSEVFATMIELKKFMIQARRAAPRDSSDDHRAWKTIEPIVHALRRSIR